MILKNPVNMILDSVLAGNIRLMKLRAKQQQQLLKLR